jgi:hypothetical protein
VESDESTLPIEDENPLAILGPYITFPPFDYDSRRLAAPPELIPYCAGLDEETERQPK